MFASEESDEPRKILRELVQIKLTDVILPARTSTAIRSRHVETPDTYQQILLKRLKLVLPRRFERHNS